MRMRCVWTGLLFAVTAAPILAQVGGAEIYKSKCEGCHGADGQSHTLVGRMTKATALTGPEVIAMADAELVATVKDGKKKMPAFGKKLSDDQIAAVVAYVRTLPAENK